MSDDEEPLVVSGFSAENGTVGRNAEMKLAGFGFMALAIVLIIIGLVSKTTVTSESLPGTGVYLPSLSSRSVINIGLLQRQMIFIELGIGSFIAGVLLFGFGALCERLAPPPEDMAATGADGPVRPSAETPLVEVGDRQEQPFDNSILGSQPLGKGEKALIAIVGAACALIATLWLLVLGSK